MATSLPPQLLQSLQNVKGFDETAFITVHQSGEQITSIRLNSLKKSKIDNLKSEIPWSSSGYYLSERPSFTLDPSFHAGAYYVQEASSMFLEQALKQTVDLSKPIKVLDLCAAPGGKSTLIQSLISKESLLISNEVIKTRANILAENITKWGVANVIVTNNDPQHFQRLANYFDVIVVDAPCSGSGLFRKDPEAINEWSENNVALCSQRQKRILADIMPSLKEGGVLIYSTCSYSKEEDEELCDWVVGELEACLPDRQVGSLPAGQAGLRLEVESSWGIIEVDSEKRQAFGYRFYPDKVKGEGFFIAVFKKLTTDGNALQKGKARGSKEKISAAEIEVIRPYLKTPDNFFFVKQNDEIIAMPLCLEADLAIIQSALYIKKAGVKLGSIIRNELIPDHELAVSTIIHETIPFVELDKQTALQYLRREEIKIDTSLKGWVLVKCEGLNLGWIKILPNRINNYYPKDWRILNK